MFWGENSIYDRKFKDSTSVDLMVMEDLWRCDIYAKAEP